MRRKNSVICRYLKGERLSVCLARCGNGLWVAVFAGAVSACATVTAQTTAPAQAVTIDQWSRLSAANNLDGEGKAPFHLKMSFQLYDLAGKEAEAGTVEEWWTPKKFRRIITSPSLNEEAMSPTNKSLSVVRERYLVDRLLDAAVRPVPRNAPARTDRTDQKPREFGSTTFDCLTVQLSDPTTAFSQPPTLCVEPDTDRLRAMLRSDGFDVVIRNSIGKFHDTNVSLELLINMVGRPAITGKVTELQAFEPATSAVDFASGGVVTAATSTDPVKPEQVAPGVLAGHRIEYVRPDYPPIAKVAHMGGGVLLHVIISKAGSIRDVVPLAVSNPMFTNYAVDAVRRWKYTPYLLNGEPTEVQTIISVNFAMNR